MPAMTPLPRPMAVTRPMDSRSRPAQVSRGRDGEVGCDHRRRRIVIGGNSPASA